MYNTEHLLPVVAVDLGGTQIRAAVLRGKHLLSRVSELTGDKSDPQHLIPRIYNVVEQALHNAEMQLADIIGIGVGVAGPLDSENGIVFCPPNLAGWSNVPLLEIFQGEYSNTPIFVENDANAAGIGEYMFGSGVGSKNYVYLTVSTGVGGCAIINGQVLRGASNTALELGHMTIDMNGDICKCGNRGCLESIASGTAIAQRAQEALTDGVYFPNYSKGCSTSSPLDAKAVAMAAHLGVPEAKAIIQKAAEALGVALVNIIHILNPDIICLGGGVTKIGAPLLEPAQHIVQQYAMRIPMATARIETSILGDDIGLVGAGAIVYQKAKQQISLETVMMICE